MKRKNTMNKTISENTISFAKSYLGLEFDNSTQEFFCTWGQYALPELVGKRKITSLEEVEKKMDDCTRNY